jgi:hypothetical protein
MSLRGDEPRRTSGMLVETYEYVTQNRERIAKNLDATKNMEL